MSVSDRTPLQRHDTTASQKVAGVDAAVYRDFQPGQRVMTRDGLAGVVQAVLDGPYPSTETYEVVLDGGMGGGSYGTSDLTAIGQSIQPTASASFDAPEVHHVASEDYPELSDILVERPPLEDAIAVLAGRKLAQWYVVNERGEMVGGPFNDAFEAADDRDEHIAADGGTYSVTQQGTDTSAFQDTFHNDGPDGDFDLEDYPSASFASMTPVSIRPQGANVIDWAANKINDRLPDSVKDDGQGRWSYDWCRFRRDERCYFPKDIDYDASKEAGYIVWIPVDRGYCSRSDWEDQKACEVGEPGPNSGDPNALVDATIPWEDGGFRQASLSAEAAIIAAARDEGSFKFHFHAAWKDIQAKAKRIRSGGGVRILAVTDTQVTGDVRGDEGVYQATLVREQGKQAIAMWECGCNWATYSWGRSGRWKKYEGRMCSHALALNYEVQARGWQGGTVTEDATTPTWAKDVKLPGDRSRPGDWQVGQPRAAVLAMAPIKADPSIEEIVAWYVSQAHVEEPKLTRLITELAGHNGGKPEGLEYRYKKPDKIEDKIHRKPRQGDPRSWVDDALRYTVVLHPAIYSAQVQDILYGLEEAGYRVVEESNTWPRGDSYSDLKYVIEGQTGLHAEVQFHTEESMELKQRTLHVMYEEFRSPSTPLRRKQELYDIMARYWEKVEIPEDVLQFPVLRTYPRPASLDPTLQRSIASLITEARGKGPYGRVQGRVMLMVSLLPDGLVKFEGDLIVPVNRVVHPRYDPRAGLSFHGSLQAQADITFTDEGLYELMGELALPPWDDQQGGYLGGELDCAPMAEHIQERVEQTRIAAADPLDDDLADLPQDPEPWDDGDWSGEDEAMRDVFGDHEAMLNDDPEPALPSTDGSAGDEIDHMVAQAMGVNASLSGQTAPQAAPGLSWLMEGVGHATASSAADSGDIAAAAAAFLETGQVPDGGIQAQAGKRFSPAEQMQIINEGEGEGVTAGNLGLLDISGTHYEALEASLSDDEHLW